MRLVSRVGKLEMFKINDPIVGNMGVSRWPGGGGGG